MFVADLAPPHVEQFVVSFGFWREHGALPEPGGLNDQPATWVDAADVFGGELARIEREMMEDSARGR